MKLTAEQRRKVKSLMEDEGNTRAEAVAWVRAFEGPRRSKTLEGLSETGNDLIACLEADDTEPDTAKGYRLPFTVDGFRHPAADALASGVKDADGIWVAKVHPLNGTASDLKRAHKIAHLFKAAPALLAALEPRSLELIAEELEHSPDPMGDVRAKSLREIAKVQRAAIALVEVPS